MSWPQEEELSLDISDAAAKWHFMAKLYDVCDIIRVLFVEATGKSCTEPPESQLIWISCSRVLSDVRSHKDGQSSDTEMGSRYHVHGHSRRAGRTALDRLLERLPGIL